MRGTSDPLGGGTALRVRVASAGRRPDSLVPRRDVTRGPCRRGGESDRARGEPGRVVRTAARAFLRPRVRPCRRCLRRGCLGRLPRPDVLIESPARPSSSPERLSLRSCSDLTSVGALRHPGPALDVVITGPPRGFGTLEVLGCGFDTRYRCVHTYRSCTLTERTTDGAPWAITPGAPSSLVWPRGRELSVSWPTSCRSADRRSHST